MKKLSILLSILLLSACAASNSATADNSPKEPRTSRYAGYVTLAEALKSMGGLQVSTNAGGTTVLVRNVNSLLLETEPLFVVDNIQRGRGYNVVANLDPKTIKTIEVRKGLVATNRWGSEGNSGVILIRTLSNVSK